MTVLQSELESILGLKNEPQTAAGEKIGNGAMADEALSAMFEEAARAGKGVVDNEERGWDTSLLRGALIAIPSDDYMVWVNIGIALKNEMLRSNGAITEEEAYEFFMQWSMKSDKFNETACQTKWEGLNPTGEKGIASIFWIARNEYNWGGQRRLSWTPEEAIQNWHGRMTGADQKKNPAAPSDNGDNSDPPDFEDEITELNHKHFVAQEGGRTRVMAERYDRVLKRRYLSSSSFEDFKNFFSNRYVEVETRTARNQPRVEYKPLGAFWLASPRRRQYDEIVFAPGKDFGTGCYNLWCGWTVKPAEGNWDLLKQHILDNICSGNEDYYTYTMNWLAYAVQFPDQQAGTAIVLKGSRGVGKGTFVSYFGDLFGQHFIHVVNSRQVTGNFNYHLRDAIVLFSDEAVYAGAKTEESTLKGLITEQYLTIEAKGKDVMTVKNNLHVIISSNNDWVVPAGVDERRFFALNVGDNKKQDTAYFVAIREQMNSGGRAAMLHELLTRNISGWNIYNVPKTSALLEQKFQSMMPVQKWWYQKLMDQRIVEYYPHWEIPIPKELIFRDYVDVASWTGTWHKGTETEVGIAIGKMIGIPGWPRSIRSKADPYFNDMLQYKSKDGRVKMWHFPPVDVCRKNFEKMIGQKINWDKDGIKEEAPKEYETIGQDVSDGVDYGGKGEAI